jgi:hypothetical protein
VQKRRISLGTDFAKVLPPVGVAVQKTKTQIIMALSVKIPFAGLFRGFFRPAENPPVAAAPASAAPSPEGKPVSPASASAISSANALHGIHNFPLAANEIELPLASVVSGLPMELRAKIMSAPAANATIRLQIEAIIQQLASGTVKISFGELRRLAPGLIANSGGEHDGRTVPLPLPEILARINPALLARHPVKTISVTDDIAGPFADRGRGIHLRPIRSRLPWRRRLFRRHILRLNHPSHPRRLRSRRAP